MERLKGIVKWFNNAKDMGSSVVTMAVLTCSSITAPSPQKATRVLPKLIEWNFQAAKVTKI